MSAFLELLIGKRLTPEEQVREWKTKIRSEQRGLERDIRQIKTQQTATKTQIKQLVKKSATASSMKPACKLLALELVRSDKSVGRIQTQIAQMNSLSLQLTQMAVMGSLKGSAQVMHTVNSLVSIEKTSIVMQEMSKEMVKAGIMDEMIMDVLETLDDEDIEEEADAEVENVLFELTNGLLGQAGAVGKAFAKDSVSERKRQLDSI